MSNEELWEAVLAQIQLNISPANFATWFKGTKIISREGEQIIVSVPSSFVKEWLEQKYNNIILKILHGLDNGIKEVKYCIERQGLKIKSSRKKIVPREENGQLGLDGLEIDKETNLNPRYTFENFVVGSFNELAHAAAQAVVQKPGLVYNPLFIYGGVGLGKTHLLEAIGNEIAKNFPEKKIKYIPSQRFIEDVVRAIRTHKMEFFKSSYRKIDLLMVDDVQFLAGKEKTQEEFFHIFNLLYEKNKQVVISSDCPPRAIPSLTERLRSRFTGGMIADISHPDFETRIVILKAKAREAGIDFSNEIYNFIAESIQKNIRELEGALNRVIIYQKINNKPPNINIVKSLLGKIIKGGRKKITHKKIISAVAEFYDLTEKDIIIPSRKKEIVRPRQIAMYLLRKELNNSFSFIGERFGGKDHTTVIHSCEKINNQLQKDKNLEEEIQMIVQRIYSS